MLRVVSVRDQEIERLLVTRAEHHQADGYAGGLASNRSVRVENIRQAVEDGSVSARHTSDTQAQACAVLDGLARGVFVECRQQVLRDALTVVGVDDAEAIEGATLRVRARRRGRRQVGRQERLALLEVALVNHSQTSRGTELGPVGGARQPLRTHTLHTLHTLMMAFIHSHMTQSE